MITGKEAEAKLLSAPEIPECPGAGVSRRQRGAGVKRGSLLCCLCQEMWSGLITRARQCQGQQTEHQGGITFRFYILSCVILGCFALARARVSCSSMWDWSLGSSSPARAVRISPSLGHKRGIHFVLHHHAVSLAAVGEKEPQDVLVWDFHHKGSWCSVSEGAARLTDRDTSLSHPGRAQQTSLSPEEESGALLMELCVLGSAAESPRRVSTAEGLRGQLWLEGVWPSCHALALLGTWRQCWNCTLSQDNSF